MDILRAYWPPGRGNWVFTFLAFAWLCVCGCSSPADGASLLAGTQPTNSAGAKRPERLTDGVVAPAGDHWQTDLTCVLSDAKSFVQYDLGAPSAIKAAYLQGDNNDSYVVSVSTDGVEFQTLWEAGPVGDSGMQLRHTQNLNGMGRYVRVSARGGDGSFAIGEVALFSEPPSAFPPRLRSQNAAPPEEIFRTRLIVFGLALVAFVLLARRETAWWWTPALGVIAVVTGAQAFLALRTAWPVGAHEVSLIRAMVAGVAIAAVLREVLAPPKLPADRRAVAAVLSICAALSLASFYNLGHPQFQDRRAGKPGFVHNYDMRVYYPTAKYFAELGYDGLYLASVAAYVDDAPGVTLQSLGNVTLRDLRTHKVTRVSEAHGQINAVRQRFTPERWDQFKQDMRYFRETMGVNQYLGSMIDHGANATPLWMTIAHALFAHTQASNTTLTLGAMLDPLLLIAAFLAVWRAFGWRTMLICMIVFGSNNLYMFGSNWGGATLRHDWMAYLAIGLSALRLKMWKTGGVLLMLGTMIRAFPALGLVGACIPVLWWFGEYHRSHGKLPTFDELKLHQRPILLVIAGAAVCGGVAWLVSSLALSFDSWGAWLHKVSVLQGESHTNHISLRGLLGGPDNTHDRIFAARSSIVWIITAIFAVLAAANARRASIERATILGLMMIPIVFHPANYYSHFIFLIPMLANDALSAADNRILPDVTGSLRRMTPANAAVWLTLLAFCVLEFMCAVEKELGTRFYFESALLVAALGCVMIAVLTREYSLGAPAAALPAKTPARSPPDPMVDPLPSQAETPEAPSLAEKPSPQN